MPKDFLIDGGFDLIITDGDILLGNSTDQNKALLFLSHPGEWRQHPLLGVGAQDFINDDNVALMAQEIQKQFEADGMQIDKIFVTEEGKVRCDAKYNY